MKYIKVFSAIIILIFTINYSNATEQVYLSDLNWQSASIGWGTIHRDLTVVGNILTLNDVEFEKGIGTHAVSNISFLLNGAGSNFQAYIGVDDEVPDNNTNASIEFEVYADGSLIFSSGTMTPTSPTQFIDLDITDVSVLELFVSDDNGSNNSDHADWADAQVTVTGTLPPSTIRIKAPITLNSSNEQIVEMFNWAKNRAYSFVQTGNGNNIPSYWAGLLDRPAFYLRDVAHQALGAHLLELDEENYSMLNRFAQSATINRKYYPIWSFLFDGSIYYLDYNSDTDFVREVPQAFEITEQALNLYKWTANQNYIDDEEMFDFYTNSVTGFVSLHDENDNGVADDNWSQQGNIFLGVCTYNEQSSDNFIEAADGLAAQYSAYLAYAEMLAIKGDSTGYYIWMDSAGALRDKFETDWYKSGQYVRGFKITGNYGAGFDQMHISYPARAGITDMAEKNEATLDMLFANYQSVWFVEARSYHAEIYFKYNQPERGWIMMNDVYNDDRRNYPEISYVLLSNCVMGIMGVDANAPQNIVMTCPRLPADIEWVEVDSVKIGEQYLYVKHEENTKTTLTNKSDIVLNWKAKFYGKYSMLLLNGDPVNATIGELNGRDISYINVEVQPNQTDIVQADSLYLYIAEKDFCLEQQIFPNPVANKVSIYTNKEIKSIEIYDMMGTRMKSVNIEKRGLITVDVSDLKIGVYIVKINKDGFTNSSKFIKQ